MMYCSIPVVRDRPSFLGKNLTNVFLPHIGHRSHMSEVNSSVSMDGSCVLDPVGIAIKSQSR